MDIHEIEIASTPGGGFLEHAPEFAAQDDGKGLGELGQSLQ